MQKLFKLLHHQETMNTQIQLCLASLSEGHKITLQPAELFLTQRTCNIRTHANSALQDDAGNSIKNVIFQHSKDTLCFPNLSFCLFLITLSGVKEEKQYYKLAWNGFLPFQREQRLQSYFRPTFIHLLLSHMSCLAQWANIQQENSACLMFGRNYQCLKNTSLSEMPKVFFLRKNALTKQHLFMYRRIWFPLVVY